MRLLLLMALALWAPTPAAMALTVTLSGSDISELTTESLESVDLVQEVIQPASIPYVGSSTATQGLSSTTSDYHLSPSGFGITFDLAVGAISESAATTSGSIFFSVDQDVGYAASGWFAAVDPDARFTRLDAILFDMDTGDLLFSSEHASDATPNESFTLGVSGGDYNNVDFGSLTGRLFAGHRYHFFFNTDLESFSRQITASASASGGFSLGFVPEPTSALLLMAGMLGVASWRRGQHY